MIRLHSIPPLTFNKKIPTGYLYTCNRAKNSPTLCSQPDRRAAKRQNTKTPQSTGTRGKKYAIALSRTADRYKSKTRARIQHRFSIMKCRCGFTRMRYKGIDKNAHHLPVNRAPINLVVAKWHLLKRPAPALSACWYSRYHSSLNDNNSANRFRCLSETN